jgi:trehalose 2-sulfotransferase
MRPRRFFRPRAGTPNLDERSKGAVNVERILQPLDATLFSSLIGVDRLTFAGDRETIEHLRRFYAAAAAPSSHQYVSVADNPASQWLTALGDRRIVVASARNENEIASRLASEIGGRPVLSLFADLFVNLACSGDPMRPATTPSVAPSLAYAIVGTPRSGSEFLCNVLRSTGQAGYPEEHLRQESQLLTRYGRFDCVRYFDALMSRKTTPNGVFGTKIISHFLREHVRLAPGLKRSLKRLRYIHIVRRDRVGQAISAMIAGKAGIWHIRDDADQDRYRRVLDAMTVEDDDLLRVNRMISSFRRQDRQLSKFLRKHRVPSMTVAYEDLIANPAMHLGSILSFLNLDARVPDMAVTLKPTRSPLSDEVRARYADSIYGRRRARLAALLNAIGLAPGR